MRRRAKDASVRTPGQAASPNSAPIRPERESGKGLAGRCAPLQRTSRPHQQFRERAVSAVSKNLTHEFRGELAVAAHAEVGAWALLRHRTFQRATPQRGDLTHRPCDRRGLSGPVQGTGTQAGRHPAAKNACGHWDARLHAFWCAAQVRTVAARSWARTARMRYAQAWPPSGNGDGQGG